MGKYELISITPALQGFAGVKLLGAGMELMEGWRHQGEEENLDGGTWGALWWGDAAPLMLSSGSS